MKKYFLSIVALAGMLFATSCQESLVEPQVGGPTTFSVQLPDQIGTKAFGDESSTNATINKLYVQVYSTDGDLVYQPSEPIAVTSGSASFSVNLIQDQEYDIIFWAQKNDAYETLDLRNIPMNKRFHNVEDGAAFFAFLDNFVPTGTSQPVTLKRPFAQLNLGTSPASLKTDVKADSVRLVQSYIKVSNVASSFSPVSGYGVGETQTMEFTLADVPTQRLYVSGEMYYYVSMDYLPIAGDDQALVTVDATINTSDGDITHTFTNVPVRENYRTNIIGNLISSTTDFVVTIEEGFVDADNDYFVVDDVADANAAFRGGEAYVAINMIEKDAPAINIDENDIETLYLQLPDADAQVTISGNKAKTIYVSVPNTNTTNRGLALVINTPNAHVELDGDGGSFQSIVATTSDNTLVLNRVVVEEVVVEQGNVIVENNSEVREIEPGANPGTIYVDDKSRVNDSDSDFENVIKEEEGNIKFITSASKLQQLAKLVNGGEHFAGQTITLLADIDLNNEEWTPIGKSSSPFKGTFDGNNHTISNLVVEGGSSSDQGLFGFTTDGEIRNLIVNNAKVSGRLNVGVVAGTPYTSKYTNIKVTGHVEVNGMAYVGGVAGKNAYANWTDIKVEVDETSLVYANSVENGTAYRTYVGGVVGFNGEGGHSFTNITSNIDVKGSTCDVGGLFGIAHYGNNFVNCSSSGDVEIYAAEDIDSAEEIGGIAGVWHNQTDYQVTFTGCSFTGKLNTNVENVDLRDNLIVGAAYSSTGNGELIIDDDVIRAVSTAEQLANYVNNATKDIVIALTADIEGNITVNQKRGIHVTILGNGKNYKGGIHIFGNGGMNDRWMTIKDINFDGTGLNGDQGCIYTTGPANGMNSYACNVTIDNCTFTGAGVAAIRQNVGGERNWTIKNCTVDNTMHSFMQVSNTNESLIIENCKVYSKNGANLNYTANASFTGCEFDVQGYAVRVGVNGSNSTETKVFNFTDCTLKSANDDGDAVVIIRQDAQQATLNFVRTTLEGNPQISGAVDGKTTINVQ